MTARRLSAVVALTFVAFAAAGSAAATTPGPNGRIAFSSTLGSSNNQLYSAAPDGTDVKRLSWTSVSEQAPAWSPDGTRIAYERGNGPFSIWVMNADGSGQTQVTSDAGGGDLEPNWSPDGRQLAFTSTRGSTGWHIWVVNADGTGLHQVTTTNDQTESPAWSPDGARIAYISAATGALFVANSDGSAARQLTTPPANWYDEHPDWSPDGSTIVFSRRDFSPTVTGLYTISADGTNERQLAGTPERAFSPSYSPDGTKILFSASSSLYTMSSDGGGISALPIGEGIQPAWGTSTTSPDVSPPDAPRVQILNPQDGAIIFPGQQVPAFYTCDSFVSFVVSCVGSTPLGVPLDTSSSGTKQLTVTATDAQGRQATASITYTVLDLTAPRIDLRTPQNGAEYEVGARVIVDYSCSDPGGSGVDLCLATLPVGAPLDTSRIGTFTFRIDALDGARNYSSVLATYRVVDHTPPTVKITASTDRTEYALGSTVPPPVYSCADSGSGVASCTGSPIDTASVGLKTFTATARDNAGNSATASLPYSVVYAFAGFQAPTAAYPGANTARPGDAVHVRFSLAGDQGLGVVTSANWVGCSDGSSLPAKTTLSYRTSGDVYDLKAFSSDSWSGSCKDLVVTLDDGTTHRARFAFSR